jgi:glycosyltransferase involved in cell wall biosynthesis
MRPALPSPKISVIIPVRNGASSLPALLRSLQDQTLAREHYEVIVVDNNSSDSSAYIAESGGAQVVYEPIANRARARNRGVAAASTNLYAFTDADCIVDPGWLEALVECERLAPLVAGKVTVPVSEKPNAIERFEALWRFNQEAWVNNLGWAATANLLVHADAFAAIGGFDPTWRHIGEDGDFCVRARKAGYQLDYTPDAVVEHVAERTLRALLRRAFLHGYSVNQAYYRIGGGAYRAWRHPAPALVGDRALRQLGYGSDGFARGEWRRMARLARLDYSARIAGSIWAEIVRAR